MTVKKAIKILDWWINQKKETVNKLKIEWDFQNDSHGVGKTLLDMDQTIISNLETIKKQLIPNCKHPKKMRDIANGQLYCMNCNWDL